MENFDAFLGHPIYREVTGLLNEFSKSSKALIVAGIETERKLKALQAAYPQFSEEIGRARHVIQANVLGR